MKIYLFSCPTGTSCCSRVRALARPLKHSNLLVASLFTDSLETGGLGAKKHLGIQPFRNNRGERCIELMDSHEPI